MGLVWKLLGGAALVGLVIFGFLQYGKARYNMGVLDERVEWQAKATEAERNRAEERVADANKIIDAVTNYADRLSTMEPIIVRSLDRVREYAKTADGATVCLNADRVLGIEQNAAQLGLRTSENARTLGPAMRALTAPEAGGRVDDEGGRGVEPNGP